MSDEPVLETIMRHAARYAELNRTLRRVELPMPMYADLVNQAGMNPMFSRTLSVATAHGIIDVRESELCVAPVYIIEYRE